MADLRLPRLTRTERLDLYGGFIDFLQQVWAWILDYWYVVLIIGGALAAVIFTKPMKRPESPEDINDPFRPGRDGGSGFA